MEGFAISCFQQLKNFSFLVSGCTMKDVSAQHLPWYLQLTTDLKGQAVLLSATADLGPWGQCSNWRNGILSDLSSSPRFEIRRKQLQRSGRGHQLQRQLLDQRISCSRQLFHKMAAASSGSCCCCDSCGRGSCRVSSSSSSSGQPVRSYYSRTAMLTPRRLLHKSLIHIATFTLLLHSGKSQWIFPN